MTKRVSTRTVKTEQPLATPAAVIVYTIFNNLSGLGSVLSAVNSALLPVYIGVIVAYLLSPLVNKMDQYVFIPLWQKIYKERKTKAKGVASDKWTQSIR